MHVFVFGFLQMTHSDIIFMSQQYFFSYSQKKLNPFLLFHQAVLASSSWDKTVRLWDVFEGKGAVETFPHTHDVLTVVYRPDGKQLACSTLDGQIHFWDPIDGVAMYTIEGRRDIAGGRLMTDRRSAANSSSGKYFTTLCYSADGSYILAGGSSKYICMYDVADQFRYLPHICIL